MLISFSVSNFLSFRENQTLNFEPEALKEHKGYLHIPYLFDINQRLLKSIALYGHNSHGKSNFLKAYSYFIELIFTSFNLGRKEEIITIDNFKLNTATKEENSSFETKFYLRDMRYRYGFIINSKQVVEEWLYYSEPKIRENYLFHRVGKEFKISKTWNKDANNRVEQILPFVKSTHLFLSVLISQENIPKVVDVEKWFRGNIVIMDINEEVHLKKAILILTQPTYRGIINRFIERADLGFTTILERIDSSLNKTLSLEKDFLKLYYENEVDNFELYTKHNVYNEKYFVVNTILFELLKSESSGTIKFLIICCYLSFAIKESQLLLIDELDSRFHSNLLKTLIEIYNDPKVNAVGSQMIFTTHNTILLNKVLRRDQVALVEKSQFGESSIRKLHTTDNPVRIDTPIEKEYLKGNFGGVSDKLSNNSMLDLGFE